MPQSLTPFDAIDEEFGRLTQAGKRFTIGGSQYDGLPNRRIALDELKAMLLHPSTSPEVRDAVLLDVCRQARSDERWTVILLGLIGPGLKRASIRVAAQYPDIRIDIDAEMIAGVIERIHGEEVGVKVATKLLTAGIARSRRFIRRETRAEWPADTQGPLDDMQYVLDRAVAAEVITEDDAELIARTRIYGEALPAIAQEMHRGSSTIRHRRMRAEAKLRGFLEASGDDK